MAGEKAILVLFDDTAFREESVRHAVQLAKRMGTPLHVLVVPGDLPAAMREAQLLLGAIEHAASQEGVATQGRVAQGDQASALLKYLAKEPIGAVIWGGDASAIAPRPSRGRRHWLGRMRDRLDCPIVAVELAGTRR